MEPTIVKSFLGVVPQEVGLFEYLTCYQHLHILAKLRGLKRQDARRRSDEILIDLDMGHYRNVQVSKISSGLKRRLLIGISALAKPSLMVLDEPTTGLDPLSRKVVWSLINRYKKEGTCVLLTTHYMEEAQFLCDQIGIIQDGKLLALDSITNLKRQLGCYYKATWDSESSCRFNRKVVYGASSEELVNKMESKGHFDYELNETTLEDLYFVLTGENYLSNA